MHNSMGWNLLGTRTASVRPIAALGKDLQDLIASKVTGTITTPTQVIEELVLNSIDANADVIVVTIDPEKNKVIVDDNGFGLNKKDFEAIGTRFSTSKCHYIPDLRHLRDYGFRGESLKEILNISSGLELYTRPSPRDIGSSSKDQGPYYRKFKNGKPIGSIYTVPNFKRSMPGLKVIVHGLLHKISLQQLNTTLDNIKKLLERIYLMNPRVNLQLKNEQTNKSLLSTSPALSTLEAFNGLYMNRLGKSNTLREVFHTFDVYFCYGWFSTETHHSKSLQMVYLNKRLLERNTIHRSLNEHILEIISRKAVQNVTAEKYAIFVVNISCDLEEFTITRGPKDTSVKFKDLNLVMKTVDGLVQTFKAELEEEKKNVKPSKKCLVYDANIQKEIQDTSYEVTTHQIKRAVHSRSAAKSGVFSSPKYDSDYT